jgi:imidazole glycerol-phosphate synthase subunit HisF
MFRPRVIPVLLLSGSGLVKTTNFKNPKYIGDPINAVKVFNDLKADELIFLDIQSSRKKKEIVSLELIKKIAEEAYMPFSIGGGVNTIKKAKYFINNGAEKIVINTAAIENPNFISECVDIFGSQSVVVSIDVKKSVFNNYQVFSHCGSKKTKLDALKWARKAVELGAGEIFINSINNDGTMLGYDLDIITKISNAVHVPVIACGGAGSFNDLQLGYSKGKASALAAGSLFIYHGRRKAVLINYPDNKTLKQIIIKND